MNGQTILILLSFLLASNLGVAASNQPVAKTAPARVAQTPSRGPASIGGTTGVTESDKPLKVQGQSRNVNMMLVLKNGSDQIHFVKVRKNYQDKVGGTKF